MQALSLEQKQEGLKLNAVNMKREMNVKMRVLNRHTYLPLVCRHLS